MPNAQGDGSPLVSARLPSGFQDTFAEDLLARQQMISAISEVYARFGFSPLETPAMEYVEVLGKYLPESDEPQGGIFALRDDDEQWIALRYDLTAPLSRVVAQYGQQLPSPYRRYQVSPVWRREKPGPGRFRQFYQCDFDTIGSASPAADAEVCAVLCAALEAVGIDRGDYQVRVNNRKVLNGVLESTGISGDALQLAVLRAVDKLDRVGLDGVRELLGVGRRDPSGDFTQGAGLSEAQAQAVLEFVRVEGRDGADACAKLRTLVAGSRIGGEGVDELERIVELVDAAGLESDQVKIDPTVVRGLGYYTGPVFEAALTFDITDEDGVPRRFGSVAGGGRYDDLVERFTGEQVPATGASIGVDRLLSALRVLGRGTDAAQGPVVVIVLDAGRLPEYQRMASELRESGIAAELYLGSGGFRAQLKYADKRGSPVAVIAGEDEFARGEVSIKDLRLGAQLSRDIKDRDEWRKGQPAQVSASRDKLVEVVRTMVGPRGH
jgi:histidyl-tRNA synthetase